MQIQFRGGPWDGVSIDAPFLPDQVCLQNLAAEFGAELESIARPPDNVCYWLRSPYDQSSFYEHDQCQAERLPATPLLAASEIARLLAKRSLREPS